jgi:class 3 adenylate cyclase
MPPITKYAKSGDVNIAYQVTGEGLFDVVLVPGWVSHVENAWEEPGFAKFLHRIKSFCRLILLDRRGTGLSDPVATLPTLEERMDDVRAVMDAAGSDRAALIGGSEGGPMCMLFAATYPQKTSALVLYGTFAKGTYAPDYPWGPKPSQVKSFLDLIEGGWGTGITAKIFSPSVAQDKSHVQSWGRFERLAVSPGAARTLVQMVIESDARHVLPTIRVPTLVLNRSDDQIAPVDGARYIAEHIPGAKYVEFPGVDHFPWVGDMNSILGEVEEFLTGVRRVPEIDRVLATVLFTDIVGSTEQAAKLGDRKWKHLLENHHRIIRKELTRFRGQEIDTAGDGFFATFDGPARAIRCACASRDALKDFDITIRAGLHTGECEIMGDKVSGIAVHIGARVMGQARPKQVLVSNTVKDLVTGSGLCFADHGVHTLKGVPGKWQLYAVEHCV